MTRSTTLRGSAARRGLQRTRVQLAGALLILIALAFTLPDPAQWWTEPAGASPSGAASAVAAVGQAVLAAAAIVVWALLAWCLLVTGALFGARCPGAAGRAGRAALLRLAPLSAVRVLAAAVGASVIVGTSACAAPLALAGADSGSSAESSTTTARAGVGSTPDTTGAAPTTGVSVDIDWPGATVSGAARPGLTSNGAGIPGATAAPPGPPAGDVVDPAPHPATATSGGGPSGFRSAATGATEVTATAVTVRPGDTLWAIAERALPLPATDVDIDTAWRSWYVANAAEIGDNPDLIRPGQVLLPPNTGVR